jgi:hypothetical protein
VPKKDPSVVPEVLDGQRKLPKEVFEKLKKQTSRKCGEAPSTCAQRVSVNWKTDEALTPADYTRW